MLSGPFFAPLALLYWLCFLLLAGLTLFIAWRGRNRPRAHARLRRLFAGLSLSLLLWIGTLFLEGQVAPPAAQLGLGRLNFAAILFAATFALLFVRAAPRPAAASERQGSSWLLTETVVMAGLTLFTPLVSAAERVEAGRAITTYGLLFPLYLLHVVGCFGAALFQAFWGWRHSKDRQVRGQLAVIGLGMSATGGISLVTNALLPYLGNDFRFCDGGPLSTLLFALAVAYATFLHGLFDLRVLLRRTLVYGFLLAFVLGTTRSALFMISLYLTAGAGQATQFAELLIAFSVDPLRRFLEKKVDHLLFGKPDNEAAHRRRTRH